MQSVCNMDHVYTFKSSEVIKNTWREPQHKKRTNFDKVASGAVHILFYDVSFYSLYWNFWVTLTLDTRYPKYQVRDRTACCLQELWHYQTVPPRLIESLFVYIYRYYNSLVIKGTRPRLVSEKTVFSWPPRNFYGRRRQFKQMSSM